MDPLERIRLELNDALELLEEEGDNETAAEHIRSVLEMLDDITLPCLGEPLGLEHSYSYDSRDEEEEEGDMNEEISFKPAWDEYGRD